MMRDVTVNAVASVVCCAFVFVLGLLLYARILPSKADVETVLLVCSAILMFYVALGFWAWWSLARKAAKSLAADKLMEDRIYALSLVGEMNFSSDCGVWECNLKCPDRAFATSGHPSPHAAVEALYADWCEHNSV